MPTKLGRLLVLGLVLLAATVDAAPMSSASAPSSPNDRFFQSSDGIELHYVDVGQGPVLVFVPGWAMPAEIWRAQIDHFSKTHRVIAFDPRGQGRSEIAQSGYTAERRARDLAELVERVDAPFTLIGWSLGVLESLLYVERAGTSSLEALVLVDNSIGEEPPPKGDPTFLTRLRNQRPATTERFVRGMYRHKQNDAYLRELTAQSLRMPVDGAVALLSYPYPREHWRKIVYSVDKPLLYVVTPRFAEQAKNLKKNRPEATIEVFTDAGHALFADQPQRFNQVLEKFLLAGKPPAEAAP
jgi:microsomal epoxide hydrolase